ncbi:hypothetical protein AMS68_007949 [Peltaster fructicola]|uniref:MARVEL domain-containing protein n=1 Tax=Peltaster fructicola TaxID=286661 RepID=A0A6H0Y5W2_9PEZI|nr:hypothetical protein AMS68_007949 [Peltaster fructicola]
MAFAISSTILLAIRAIQALLAIIVLGTAADVAVWWGGAWHAWSPSEFSFLIFSAVWTLLVLVYLIVVPLRFSESVLHHRFAVLAVESVTMLFWFAGFIAAAVFMTGRICFGDICKVAKACIIVAAFEWLLFAITTGLAALQIFSSRGTVRSNKHIVSQPAMTQEGV